MNPLYCSPPKDKVYFILHIVNTSGYWDQRDIGPSPIELPHTLPMASLGSIESTKIGRNLYIIHAYAACGIRSKYNIHPISYPFLGKCILNLENLNNVNCIVYLSKKSCRLQGGNPSIVLEMLQGVLKDTTIIAY